MTNQIRPLRRVLEADRDTLILEISVESAVEEFTWVILDDTGMPVRFQTRSGDVGDELSVTVTPDHYIEKEEGPHLGAGDYRVRLFHGSPSARRKKLETLFDDLPLLDEDAFSIVNEGTELGRAPSEGGDVGEPLRVALVREGPEPFTPRASPVTFLGFREFLEEQVGRGEDYDRANAWPAFGSGPYLAVRNAARDYVARSTVRSFEDLIPAGYLEAKLDETERQFPGVGLPRDARTAYLPGVELIWNYWLEEGGLVQTLHVILARFQNRRLRGRDPLGRFDVTPLLPLRNKLWGYAEDEVHRMTVRRRAVEYEYEYGFPMIGKAVPNPRLLVERRSGFLETFHQVLFLAHQYFKELDDLTVQADPFPLYRALRDCHIVLSQGTQNQYGEMAVAARAEFLLMQNILAEPQMREFLGGRPMTPYPEEWMDRVDTMKGIQGWNDASIMHFNDLATIGEQLVLTIRLGGWAAAGVNGTEARNWAQAFRGSIQQYAAAYRSVTGVDLSREPNAEAPAVLLARRTAGRARA